MCDWTIVMDSLLVMFTFMVVLLVRVEGLENGVGLSSIAGVAVSRRGGGDVDEDCHLCPGSIYIESVYEYCSV